MQALVPGEWQRQNSVEENNNSTNNELGDMTPPNGSSYQSCEVNDGDAASVVSGISSMLSLSPILRVSKDGNSRRSSFSKQCPRYYNLPPLLVDAQLVTKKVGKDCQRLLLLRMFRVQDVARATGVDSEDENDEEAYDVVPPLEVASQTDPLLESKRNLSALQVASALCQRIKAVGGSGFAIHPQHDQHGGDGDASVSSHTSYLKSFGSAIISPIRYLSGSSSTPITNENAAISPPVKNSTSHPSMVPSHTVGEMMSTFLLQKCVPSPSVGMLSKEALAAAKRKSRGIFPALSTKDAPYVKSSWMFLKDCIEELDRRCLAYSTLAVRPLFKFPALPTLDAHFIAQINVFCRESMISSLVKTASELEIYAREEEVSCGNVEQLLRPMFDLYEITPPPLPVPVPLTAYPLDFRAPEETRPPWGPEVMAELEKISDGLIVHSSSENQKMTRNSLRVKNDNPFSSFEQSERAIFIVVAAFQRQNDVEQGARLGRKNMQVMDRLAKMQSYKRSSIAKIRSSYGTNTLATQAADEFHALLHKTSNAEFLMNFVDKIPVEVPLLTCNVLVGNAPGTCHLTLSHILFNTQLVPILGSSEFHLFSIMDVELTVTAPSKSMLNPLPACISLTTSGVGTREEIYKFVPSIGARRFAKFLEVLRDVSVKDPKN